MIVSLIVAISNNKVIGKNNQLIWNLPKDMKFFMDTTLGHPVIMGRKNFESIPEKFRPLKNRTNIIITRNKNYEALDCKVVHSIKESLKCMDFGNEEVFVIGGGEIYRKFLELDLIDKMYITHIDEFFDGDTFFPDFNLDKWISKEILNHQKDDENPHDFKVIEYSKKN
jgi:dihydrofolate reductase